MAKSKEEMMSNQTTDADRSSAEGQFSEKPADYMKADAINPPTDVENKAERDTTANDDVKGA